MFSKRDERALRVPARSSRHHFDDADCWDFVGDCGFDNRMIKQAIEASINKCFSWCQARPSR